MQDAKTRHLTLQVVAGSIPHAITQFLIERRSRGLSPATLEFYTLELDYLWRHLDTQGVIQLDELSAESIRAYLLALSEHRNGGGCHAAYRAIRAWLRWTWEEYEIESRNPIERVSAPKRSKGVLPGVALETVARMVEACQGDPLARRDSAILLTLLDTGARAGELSSLDVGDLDPITGALIIRHGKGDKYRAVYVGSTTRRAIRAYLRARESRNESEPLFTTIHGDRFSIPGLRRMIEKRADQAGVDPPALHAFRRTFALEMLRAGVDVYALRDLMGHSDLETLRRYLDLAGEDLRAAHRRGSPVERMKRK